MISEKEKTTNSRHVRNTTITELNNVLTYTPPQSPLSMVALAQLFQNETASSQ